MVSDIPHVDESFSQIVVDSRDPDLPKDDGTVAGRARAHFNKVLLKTEVHELLVG